MRSLHLALPIAVSVAGLAFACGSTSDRSGFDPNGGQSSGAPGSSGTFSSGGNGTSGASGSSTCAAVSAKTDKAKVDLIFVIDDSGSMTEEMVQIKANVNTFASTIGGVGLDYVVIFIVRKGTIGNTICVPPPLGGAGCADNAPTFFHVDQDVQSNDSLQLILSTYDTKWKPHLRTDSTKVFIEVTDDESDSAYTSFDSQLLAKTPTGIFGTATDRHYVFHSIISKPDSATAPTTQVCPTAANTSVQYQQLSMLTGGMMEEVCKTDYSPVLNNIAKGIVDKLGCQLSYPTAEAADPTKVVVQFTPAGQPGQKLTQVTDVSKCASVPNAWYYDNPTAPTKIILCPSMCTTANGSAGAKLEALVGCKAPEPS